MLSGISSPIMLRMFPLKFALCYNMNNIQHYYEIIFECSIRVFAIQLFFNVSQCPIREYPSDLTYCPCIMIA